MLDKPDKSERNRLQRIADEKAFLAKFTALACPDCGENYTDGALEWGRAWVEGRLDLWEELGKAERDGPFKIKCEWCDQRAYLNYFAWKVSKTP